MENFEYNFNVFKPAFVRQVQSWFWLNPVMRKHLRSLDKLVDVDHADVHIDLQAFNQFYIEKFITPSLEKYCLGLIEYLRPFFYNFTKLIGYGGYSYLLHFRLGGQTFEKGISIVVVEE